MNNKLLFVLPLLPPGYILYQIIASPQHLVEHSKEPSFLSFSYWLSSDALIPLGDTIRSQLFAYLIVATLGFAATEKLIPHIKEYTLRKGISGKDLGKKWTPQEDREIPEALGIVPGAVFLVCLIFCLVGYAAYHPHKLLEVNSALLSICFMLFLGFTDDVLDWPWRYKLFLPTVASLPLLSCYNGSTSIVVPVQLRWAIWNEDSPTSFGQLLNYLIRIDPTSNGALVDLGFFYLLYMGMLAVFCTNAINIYAGINGLEAGQSYIIGCAILFHNLVEIRAGHLEENHLFSIMLILSFVGVTMALLKHNWYPASVFVGDTFCYFAGMTFAVVAILGHFSKTLLLFFIPQIVNFLWSTPQLFKFVPCPRHRLPKVDGSGKMHPSTFPCKKDEFLWLKRKREDTEAPNMTVINLCLQIMGPMPERELCLVLLTLQAFSCFVGFTCRYYLAQFFFDA